jgi:hypothetical protein
MKPALILVALMALAGCVKKDDSDPPDGRSGFNVFIGWSPSSLRHGAAITPRLGLDGLQICRIPAKGGAE